MTTTDTLVTDTLSTLHRLAWMTAAVAGLAACGGGGGGGGSPPPPPAPSAPVTVSGTARFESVPNNNTNGALNYAAATFQPIRGATVQLVDTGGNTLATAKTSDTGTYTLGPVNVTGAVLVRVRAELTRTGATGGSWDFTVRDNTTGNALYVLDSPAAVPASTSETRNLDAGSGWGGTSYTSARSAAPFAVLDTVYRATQKVLSVAPNQAFAPLSIYWSVNNRPVSGNRANGEIGTSFFTFDGTTRQLYLLGAANTDTDEYDTHVVAHEWGHYFQNALSRDDSVGGSHGSGDRLDMRVAFSEGWGNAWSGMALGGPLYADSGGSGQAAGFIVDVSAQPANANRGFWSEDSVQYLMWNFHQEPGIGFGPIFNTLTGALRTSSLLTAIHHFAAQLKSAVPAAAGTVNTLLTGQQINTTDALGTNESNSGGFALGLPVYNTWANNTTQYCVSTAAGTPNKLGLFKNIRFTTATAGNRTITVTAAGASDTDPDFEVVRSDGSVVVADSAVANSETGATTLAAGTHTLVLTDYNLRAGASSGQRCFTVNVQ